MHLFKKYCPVCVPSVKASFIVTRKSFSYSRKVREAGMNVREELPPPSFFFPISKRDAQVHIDILDIQVWVFAFNIYNFMFGYWNAHSLCSQSISSDARSSTFMTCRLHYLISLQFLHTFSVVMLLFLQITDSFNKWQWAWKASQQDFSF